jgi:YidC/Oxa1 family membrane protein insertase
MLDPIINIFLNIMIWISQAIESIGIEQSFGWTIILFTIIIRLALYPFTASQVKSAQAMQEMQNSEKWQKIQKKYKDDREKLAQEQMKLYQEMGINPLGSCLPTLLQLPIIFALYWSVTRALASTPVQLLELARVINGGLSHVLPLNSTFLWMDLGQPERLYLSFLPTIGIPVLAILVTVTSFLQTKLMTPTSQPGEQGAAMSRAMSMYMPLLIGWISYSYAAGLALYFFIGNIASIAQYAFMGRLDIKNLLPSAKTGK